MVMDGSEVCELLHHDSDLRLTNGYRCATGVYVYVDVLYVSLEGT